MGRGSGALGWRLAGAAWLMAVLLAGCQTAEPQVPAGTVPETPEPAGEVDDPYAIPEVIDEAYVERVMEAINQIELSVLTRLQEEGEVTPSVERRIRSAYGNEAAEGTIAGWQELLELDPHLSMFSEDPNAVLTIVDEIREAKPDCIVAAVSSDFSGQYPEPAEPVDFYVQLEAPGPSVAPNAHNPTPWIIAGEQRIQPDTPEPENACNGD